MAKSFWNTTPLMHNGYTSGVKYHLVLRGYCGRLTIKLASRKTDSILVATSWPPSRVEPDESCETFKIRNGRPISKPNASAVTLFPVPAAPQNNTLVHCLPRELDVSPNPQVPNNTLRAFSNSIMAYYSNNSKNKVGLEINRTKKKGEKEGILKMPVFFEGVFISHFPTTYQALFCQLGSKNKRIKALLRNDTCSKGSHL